jgi:hypothetical protein
MANQAKDCFIAVKGKKYGPLSEQDIQKLYDQNKINDNTQFYRKGMKAWVKLSDSGIIEDDTPDLDDDDDYDDYEEAPARRTMSKKPFIALAFLPVVAVAVVLIINIFSPTVDAPNPAPRPTPRAETRTRSTPSPSPQDNAETPPNEPSESDVSFGTMTLDNGGEYEGELANGIPNGQGRSVSLDGTEYVGEWIAGRFDGFGTLTAPDGRVAEGYFKDGVPHGDIMFTDAAGTVSHMVYEYGVRVSPAGDPSTAPAPSPSPPPVQVQTTFVGMDYIALNNPNIVYHYRSFDKTSNEPPERNVFLGTNSVGVEIYYRGTDRIGQGYAIVDGNFHMLWITSDDIANPSGIRAGTTNTPIGIHGSFEVNKNYEQGVWSRVYRYYHLDSYTLPNGSVFNDVILQTYYEDVGGRNGRNYRETYYARGIGMILTQRAEAYIEQGE